MRVDNSVPNVESSAPNSISAPEKKPPTRKAQLRKSYEQSATPGSIYDHGVGAQEPQEETQREVRKKMDRLGKRARTLAVTDEILFVQQSDGL